MNQDLDREAMFSLISLTVSVIALVISIVARVSQ